jgi:hypothetical protein
MVQRDHAGKIIDSPNGLRKIIRRPRRNGYTKNCNNAKCEENFPGTYGVRPISAILRTRRMGTYYFEFLYREFFIM